MIYVTGYTGFIGSSVKELLRYLDFNVYGIGRTNWDDLFFKKTKNDIIIHCAASLESGKLNREMDDDLIDFVKESGDKLIYLSTINDSGTSYAKEKRNSEKRIESEIEKYVIFKISSPYGVGQKRKTVISKSVERAFNGKDIYYYGDGSREQDFIYVDDLARLIVIACQNDVVGMYHATYGHNINMINLTRTIANIFSVRYFRGIIHDNKEKLEYTIFDNSQTCIDFNWFTPIGIEEGITKMKKDLIHKQNSR